MFETTFEAPHRSAQLTASALLHGLLGASLVMASTWAVHDPPEPSERIRELLWPAPRVEPIEAKLVEAPRGSPSGGSPRATTRMPRSAAPVQPRVIGDLPAVSAAPPAEDFDAPPGAPGEQASDGLGSGTEPGPVGVPDGGSVEPIFPANAPDVTPPVALITSDPPYPSVALRLRKQGIVILEAIIDSDGQVRSARVLRSAGEILDRAATDAVQLWRYRPARVGARAVAVYLTVTVRFSIPT